MSILITNYKVHNQRGTISGKYCIFVKPFAIPKFEPSNLDFCIHITDNHTMKFLLYHFMHKNELQWCLTSSKKASVRLMSAIASCSVKPTDNIVFVDIVFETPSNVFSRGYGSL